MAMDELQKWKQCKLPVHVNTESKSKTFVKKAVGMSISNICFVRTNFPEECFGNLNIGGRVPIRMLHKTQFAPANVLLANLRGAFDAYDKNFLRALELVIQDGEADDAPVLEKYTFKFTKSGDAELVESLFKGKAEETMRELTAMTPMRFNQFRNNDAMEKLRKVTRTVMHQLCVATESLEELPLSATMSMHLTYSPETPEEYEAPGFVPTTDEDVVVRHSNARKALRKISTGFQTLQIEVDSSLAPVDHDQPPPEVEQQQQQEEEAVVMDVGAGDNNNANHQEEEAGSNLDYEPDDYETVVDPPLDAAPTSRKRKNQADRDEDEPLRPSSRKRKAKTHEKTNV